MCGMICAGVTIAVGAALVVLSSIVGYVVIPDVITNLVINEVVLLDDSIQMERFEQVPFGLNFSVYVFNMSNSADVVNGAVPVMDEIGPYIYKLYQGRNILETKEDQLRYYRMEHFEFDAEASYPLTEDDMVTIVNVPYHAIIQIAERDYPELMPVLGLAMNGVFGQHNAPVATYNVRALLLGGVPLCENPGLIGTIACSLIRSIGATAQNLEEQEDGSVLFSILGYKNGLPSKEYLAYRGLSDTADLGRLAEYDGRPRFVYWPDNEDDTGVCNTIKGTDAGIFSPFVDRNQSIFAINSDICRALELKYELDIDFEGITAARFAANEWFLDNNEGCYCLNTTTGITREDGCLHKGAMELYTCIGAFLVLTYPHFLFADARYRNGVIGMRPIENDHKIFIDIEPMTGTPIRGYKRAQFNIFTRPIAGISATQNFRTTLTPIVWVEESLVLPEEFVIELQTRMLTPLTILDIAIPTLIAASALVFILGVVFTIKARLRRPDANSTKSLNESNDINKQMNVE